MLLIISAKKFEVIYFIVLKKKSSSIAIMHIQIQYTLFNSTFYYKFITILDMSISMNIG